MNTNTFLSIFAALLLSTTGCADEATFYTSVYVVDTQTDNIKWSQYDDQSCGTLDADAENDAEIDCSNHIIAMAIEQGSSPKDAADFADLVLADCSTVDEFDTVLVCEANMRELLELRLLPSYQHDGGVDDE